jgi:uncharacterized membrane protein
MKGRVVESLIDVVHSKGIADDDQEELILALTLFSEHNIDIAARILGVKATGRTRCFSLSTAASSRGLSLIHHATQQVVAD